MKRQALIIKNIKLKGMKKMIKTKKDYVIKKREIQTSDNFTNI